MSAAQPINCKKESFGGKFSNLKLTVHFFLGHANTWSQMPKKGTSGAHWWHWEKADPNCELNTLEYPTGSTPLHQIFEGTATRCDWHPLMTRRAPNEGARLIP